MGKVQMWKVLLHMPQESYLQHIMFFVTYKWTECLTLPSLSSLV